MRRLILAFICFFRVLFGKPLPADFPPKLLPPPPEPPRMDQDKLLAEATAKPAEGSVPIKKTIPVNEKVMSPLAAAPAPAPAAPAPAPGPSAKEGALQLLGMLQREGRLIDFLREPIDAYDDATIGAAVRDIHRGCKKALEEHFELSPIMGGAENDAVTVDKGFDPARIRLVGAVKGEPPFRGTLKHHGWAVVKVKLPQATSGMDHAVVAPAEVEL